MEFSISSSGRQSYVRVKIYLALKTSFNMEQLKHVFLTIVLVFQTTITF